MYLSLARKYRPRTFADVAVQSHVSTTLKGAIARGRVAHGYLLCGPRGVGKTTLARVLAMALNCERRAARDEGSGTDAGEPCGECASCTRIWAGSASLDVVEIDAASNRGVDDARDLRERAMYAPSTESHYKVYIVDEAHMLTREAWNALLKILEEPPPRVIFVFATTEPQKIAQTAAPVLSRLQRFDFKRISPADVRDRLTTVLSQEGVEADVEALTMIARAADGSMRDALSLTDQVLAVGEGRITAARVQEALGLVAEDEYLAALDLIAERRAADVFPFVNRLSEAGIDFGQFLAGLGDMIRAQLAVVLGGDASDVSDHARQALLAGSSRFAAGDLLRMLAALSETEMRFKRSGQQQLLLETLLVRFALMDRTVALEEVLRAIGDGAAIPESSGAGGRRSRPEPPAPRSSAQGVTAVTARDERRATRDAGGEARDAGRATRDDGGGTRGERGGASDEGVRSASVAHDQAALARYGPVDSDAPIEDDIDDSRRASTVGHPLPLPPPNAQLAAHPASDPPRRASRVAPPASDPARRASRVALPASLAERWDDVVHAAREVRPFLGAALEKAIPVAVTPRGDVALELDAPDEIAEQAIAAGSGDVAKIIGKWFDGVTGVRITSRGMTSGPPPAARRLTAEEVKAERLATLKRRDPTLAAAIDALDLEMLD